ncbi:hypothetical protein QQS21_002360 [Conoideocrella luteorostrata]|uniref:Uncharacterized protein n=1 Tax=Conoideocrella luteorostrata TaxID=1105319 RepID=A0AAJ0CYF7_9HYPO|nr:hypothetical protein QQS21_002360 [Conoideocrella luteorostrata]
MPRKSSMDTKAMDESTQTEKAPSKTQRSHEENQERAYIAASRRGDRSIEARVQSAHMASEIHKKRTGKGFKITEDVVINEEMYEEEDDVLPRSIRLLGAEMQTESPMMNSRVESFVSAKMTASDIATTSNTAWRHNRVNRLFAESFPGANNASLRMPLQESSSNSPEYQLQQPVDSYSPTSYNSAAFPPAFTPASYSPSAFPQVSTAGQQMEYPYISSFSYLPKRSQASKRKPREKASAPSSAASPSGVKSRRNSSKASPAQSKLKMVTSPSTCATPSSDSTSAWSPRSPEDTILPSGSAFTTDLPPEARMLLHGVGADAVLDETLANQDGYDTVSWLDPLNMFDPSTTLGTTATDGADSGFVADLYGNGSDGSMPSKCAMPTQNLPDVEWGAFIDDSMWPQEQPQEAQFQ